MKYTGVWDGKVLRAVTNEVVSKPNGVQWEPEAFALQFSDDGKTATYECNADGKIYVADLTPQTLGSTTAAKLSSIYKGTITGGAPLTIAFGADRKSGTMTQTARSGDVVVKFAGVWDGPILRAVTRACRPRAIECLPRQTASEAGSPCLWRGARSSPRSALVRPARRARLGS